MTEMPEQQLKIVGSMNSLKIGLQNRIARESIPN